MRRAALTAASCLLAACGAKKKSPPPKPSYSITSKFLFGSAIASYQVESGLHASDWYEWEQLPGKIQNGDHADDGPDFAHVNADGSPGGNYPAYLAEARQMGHDAIRLSLDWSRIQPTQSGGYDANAIRLYHAILAECRKDGLEPMVTLQHFVLPTWVNDVVTPSQSLGGWQGPDGSTPGQAPIVDAFAKFAGDMAKEFGGQVDLWVTINEPLAFVAGAFLDGSFPGPGQIINLVAARHAVINMAYAHARAYDAIHANDTVVAGPLGVAASVGIAQHLREVVPASSSSADQKAAAQIDYIENALFLDQATKGDADWNADGTFDPAVGEGKGIAALKGRLDWVGVNYYSRHVVASTGGISKGCPGPDCMTILGIPAENATCGQPNATDPMNADGSDCWEIYPQGMYDMLMWAANRYGLPIYVTENGLNDRSVPDARRPAFVVNHLARMQQAMHDGADVRGYFHWALMDNFEWAKGFTPRFGLLRVDYATKAFTPTQGAQAYTDVIQTLGVTPAIQQKWAP